MGKKTQNRHKLWIGLSCSILCLLSLSIPTYAWFTTFWTATNKLTLVSGTSSLEVDFFGYGYHYSADSHTESLYNLNNGQSISANGTQSSTPDSDGVLNVSFASSALSPGLHLGDIYGGELYMDSASFPSLLIELRYKKEAFGGFAMVSLSYGSLAQAESGYTNISSLGLFQYRYATVQNTSSNKTESGVEAGLSTLRSTAYSTLWTASDTADKTLYGSSDVSGAETDPDRTLKSQCYVPAFPYRLPDDSGLYYSKSTLLEIRIDPLMFLSALKAADQPFNTLLKYGIDFQVGIRYSNDPYYEA